MFRKIFSQIFVFLIVSFCFFILTITKVKASELIWSLSATTDCSRQGGTNGDFTSPCRNQNGTNFADYEDSFWHDTQVIRIPLIIGHNYHYQSSASDFSFGSTNGNADYIAQQISSVQGLGGDYFIPGGTWSWYCSDTGLSCNPTRQYTLDFTAKTNYVYLFYFAGCDNSTGCYLNDLSLTDENATSSPTPTPTSITKTILVPGLGASWNTEAFLGCQNNTTSEWNLSSFAEDIYNPIIQTLTDSGWTTLPFYYDWRQTVSTNSERLTDYINGNSIQDEKVNLVGHSMGGLVGRGYLETSSGGKLSSLLTVGTPNKGSALAYPPWEGGDIWNDNFIEKIATTLYLKHCGGIGPTDKDTIQNLIPSLKDLLPTEAYLQKNNITTPYLPVNSNNQNIWLTDLSNNPWGVRLGYVAGTGFDTLKTIKTKDPNKRDSKLGNWEDGKPAGKIFSSDGDGTILADSAILPNADISYLINQTHEGLINSIEGMSKILEFLGTPQISNQQTLPSDTSDVNSALIIIADPASFTVTNQNGKTKMAKDGMVSFVNPGSGNYKLNLLPKSNNTLFIVAQFLPNGDIKYKEYNLKGLGPKFKTLKFNLQEAQDDILVP